MTLAREKNPFTDPWEGWAPELGKGADSPHALQERHSPTESARLRNSTGMQTRRLTDARLWESMTGAQQDAAYQIADVATLLGRGLGYTTSDWKKIPGSAGRSNASEAQEKLVAFYAGWARRCKAENISQSLILDILVHGFTCAAIDRDRVARRGWARRNLMKGLKLYCRMKGWPVN